jgi:hypothetical protein
MRVKNRYLHKLIERARRGEDIGLRHDDDVVGFATLEGILDTHDCGGRLSEDDIDVLVEAGRYAVLPKTGGRLRKSDNEKQREARIKTEARAYQNQHRDWDATVAEMKRRYPAELADKSVKTLKDRWSRR